jgi:iron complex outermembrane recepter protein
MTFSKLGGLLLLSSTILSSGAYAQSEAAVSEKADNSALQNEDIVVTATRRASQIQTTPVAVSAVGAAQIESLVSNNVGDLQVTVPGFSASIINSFNAASFAMRGVGQVDILVYLDPPVGVNYDDFVVPSVQTQLIDTFDVERVEVLRGPQGTLFGKNTTAGIVNIVSKRPKLGEFSAEGRLRYSSFNTREAAAALNIPVFDTLALRFSGQYTKSDGYYRNGASFGPTISANPAFDGLSGGGDNRRLGGQDVFSGRAKALWEPTSNVKALFQYEIIRDRSEIVPVVNETPGAFVFGQIGLGGIPAGVDPLKLAGAPSRRTAIFDFDKGSRLDVDGYYANVDWNIGNATITSVTGFRKENSAIQNDFAGKNTPFSLFDAMRRTDRKTFQQELRIASDFSGPLNFVAGAFYQKNDAKFCAAYALGFLDVLGVALPFGTFDGNPQIICSQQKANAYAAYVDTTYELTDKLSVRGGIRYTIEKKAWRGRNQVFIQDLPTGPFDPNFTQAELGDVVNGADFNRFPENVESDSKTWREPTYNATISYKFTPDVYGYLTYAHGFKSGSYNEQVGASGFPITDIQKKPFNPEKVDSFEVGLKTDLFDRLLRFNITGYYAKYKDAQRSLVATLQNQFGTPFQETRFFNGAVIDVKGIELETTLAPMQGLTIRANGSYLKGKYKKFEADTDFDGVVDIDLSNRPLNRAPKYQFGVDGSYQHSIGAIGSLTWNANIYYESSSVYIYSDVDPAFNTQLDSKTLIQATLTYRDPSENYYVRVYGKNLTDSRYRISSQPIANLTTFTSYGAPRSYGVEVGFKF